ncbi:hypothetical protein PV08_02224 [Exophiala spinifera]|uniref:Carboxylic ester hydrolase n=1 Tax=Exophiala spinifera TaxID=91928 RepID=A0A0D2CDM7_9EURO|nr:uncharacterized protein PV08_02224 [Exophiala spinifera]KIW21644.1 hypothetical protein PV08_02224 [Exophiala spinifera]
MASEVFVHPALGTLVGISRGDDIVQFRGIPYAEVPARFRQSILRPRLPKEPFDARQPGPSCPQTTTLPFPQYWTGPLPPDGVKLDRPKTDEFNCLNLNLTIPRAGIIGTQKLPVLVYIHGGGFMVGSCSAQIAGREVWDATDLVRRSLTTGKPIIVVSINYRHGPLGFLASNELTEFNRQHGEAVGNYGLHDQRQALEWVSRFITGFGGDADNVTIDGGSAGAVSCHFQTFFPHRKFKRAMLFSGTCLALAAMRLEWHQKIFNTFAQRFPGAGSPVERLQKVSPDVLTHDVVGVWYTPLIDGEWIAGRTLAELKSIEVPPEFLIGSCSFEQDLTLSILRPPPILSPTDADKFMRTTIISILSTLGLTTYPDTLLSQKVLELYSIAESESSPTKQFAAWAQFVAELVFRIPPYHVALNHTGSKTYVYEFQATSPFPGWDLGFGKAGHAVNELLQFNAGGDLVEQKHQAALSGAVQELQDVVVNFCQGQLRWEPFDTYNKERLGPVYTLTNYGRGRKYGSIGDVVGLDVLGRWKAILEVSER